VHHLPQLRDSKRTNNWVSDADIARYGNLYKTPYALGQAGIKVYDKVSRLGNLHLKAVSLS